MRDSMIPTCFNQKDMHQIITRGQAPETVLSQIEIFKRGIPYTTLHHPCTVYDGITVLQRSDIEALGTLYAQAVSAGRVTKFVPASGAATRMFQALLSYCESIEAADSKNDQAVLQFINNLQRFAFYDDLQAVVHRHGGEVETYLAHGQYAELLAYLLTSQGLNYANLPKILLKFHHYGDHCRTPLEEHLVEAAAYAQGHLLFRPGGQGALLANLQALAADIVFIKNIDNVVPDHLKEVTYRYKRALGGHLLHLQQQMFAYLEHLAAGRVDAGLLEEIRSFAWRELAIVVPPGLQHAPQHEQIRFLHERLHRPLRVCGMVRNEGAPGGGPFWVAHPDGSLSRQIVETSQIDTARPEQRALLAASTHFNPVDLVCGVRDYRGQPFDLQRFADTNTVFISHKTYDGRPLKALELPGLWNGAMAYWNTVFVELPLSTFSPVKTVLDLLRPEHQP